MNYDIKRPIDILKIDIIKKYKENAEDMASELEMSLHDYLLLRQTMLLEELSDDDKVFTVCKSGDE